MEANKLSNSKDFISKLDIEKSLYAFQQVTKMIYIVFVSEYLIPLEYYL